MVTIDETFDKMFEQNSKQDLRIQDIDSLVALSVLKGSNHHTLLYSTDSNYLGVQQCFVVVYHELTTLRRVKLPEQNKPVLALLIHDIPR